MKKSSISVILLLIFTLAIAQNNDQTLVSGSTALPSISSDSGIESEYVKAKIQDALRLFEAQFDRLVMSHRLPSFAYGLSINGTLVTHRRGGSANLENEMPILADSRFRVSSITKTFTALAIAQAVKEGKLSYSDSVWKHLNSDSEFPKKRFHSQAVNITVGQLLTHTSGLSAFDDETDLWQINPVQNCTTGIRKLSARPLRHLPGSTFEFSHYGYQILGAILEKVHQSPFPELLESLIQKQLALRDTVLELPDKIIDRQVQNYKQKFFEVPGQPGKKYGQNIPAGIRDDLLLSEAYWPAIGILSTVPDMLKYGETLLDIYHGTSGSNVGPIDSQGLRQMWSEQTSGNQFGYGWAITELKQADYPEAKLLQTVWHDGQLHGSSAILQIYPPQRIVAVAFSNVGAIDWLDLMMISLAESVYGAIVA